jgi:carotenoid cleavage dioxygenase-like enzyme
MKGFFAPQRFEADVYDCEVQGKIPSALNGSFVRVGSGWQYPPKHADDSPFNEDGYVSMFRFKNGVVDYKGRWVRTERWVRNAAAGRQLYGYYRNPYDDDPSVRDIAHPNRRTVSNTTPVAHAGKLFALN